MKQIKIFENGYMDNLDEVVNNWILENSEDITVNTAYSKGVINVVTVTYYRKKKYYID
ncbi:hypothetical protein [Companilactobacillus sp. DQM5]|uniref:hypothetical protein n=1 Tax=Companilactobacillus sp. DQM5 TaxID=3463359 RepID=UPI004059F5C0